MASALNPGLMPIWPITVEQYHAMLERGIFRSGDPIELLEGVIVQKPLINPSHSVATDASRQTLKRVIPTGWFVRAQNPITLADSEPEPDLAVIRGNIRDYRSGHPGAHDVGLLVEISDTPLERDRIAKKRIYAESGIPWYWILDLKERKLEVYSEPRGDQYARRATYEAQQTVEVILDGQVTGAVKALDLLP